MNIVPVINILVHQVTSESHDPVSPPTFLSVWSWGKMLTHTQMFVLVYASFWGPNVPTRIVKPDIFDILETSLLRVRG